MITVIITAYKEPESVKKTIKSIVDPIYSGYKGKMQVIQVTPDEETLQAGSVTLSARLPDGQGVEGSTMANIDFEQIKDPGKGKPFALNLAFEKVSKDSKLVILTDGDVNFEKNAVKYLVEKFEESDEIGAISGRPVSIDPKDNIMGYYGHLFADANHYRREIDLADAPQERSKLLVRKHRFFPLSGYIMAVRSNLLDFKLPEDVLADDAFISYKIFNKGKKLDYEPKAKCFIKYPKNLADYFRQKKRSTGGYIQLWKYDVVKEETKSRSPWHELEMIWFPFKYASNFKEFIWSSFLIPIRAWLWFRILLEQKVFKRDFSKVWVRVESTK